MDQRIDISAPSMIKHRLRKVMKHYGLSMVAVGRIHKISVTTMFRIKMGASMRAETFILLNNWLVQMENNIPQQKYEPRIDFNIFWSTAPTCKAALCQHRGLNEI